tara:strand:+ start:460 stop:882 length:423 start_codon:yes stop_codon:yes gene_type:complete
MNKHSHFGVYGVISSGTKMLVIKKARGPYTGLYDLPGGSSEDGELLEQTVTREILEETGCTVEKLEQIKAVSALYPYQDGDASCELRHIGVLFQVEISGDPMTEGDGQDSNGCVWLNLSKLDENNATPFVLMAKTFHMSV